MWILHVMIQIAVLCTGLSFTFTQSEECRNLQLQGELLVEDNLNFFFIGESANISCNISSKTIPNFSLSNFRIKVKKCDDLMDLETNSLDRNGIYTIMMQDPIVDLPCPQPYLDYICYYKVDKEDCLLERHLVYFEYAPSLFENFTCLVDNWKNMTCSFDMGVTYRQWNLTSFNSIHISVKAGMEGYVDDLTQNHIKRIGQVMQILIPEDQFFLLMYEIRINISNNARHVFKESCFRFDTKAFVKPSKISGLVVSANATAFNLKWTHSNKQMSKKFRLCYTSEWNPTNLRCKLTSKNEYSIVLMDLWPFTTYNISIDVRPLFMNGTETGFWSEKEIVIWRTAEDVPVAVPKFWPGYFQQTKDDYILIYWQPISKQNQCGIIKSYRVTLVDIVPHGEQANETEFEVLPPSRISYPVKIEPGKKYRLNLTQRTALGYPYSDDAHIFLYPKSLRPVLSDKFSVHGITNTSVEVQWGPGYIPDSNPELTNILTYHIVWCKALFEECTESINSKILTTDNVTSYDTVITVKGGHFSEYRYGISVEGGNKAGWFISSGITWFPDCIYLRCGVPKTPLLFEIPQDVEQDDGIFITWEHYSCIESSGRVSSYLISYCLTDGSKDECQGKLQNVTVNSSATSYKLKGLNRGKKYIIKVRAKMENGQNGPWSKPEKVLYKSLKTVEKEKMQVEMAVGIGIFCGIAVIVFLVIVVCFCRKKWNKHSEELNRIDVPVIPFRNNYDSLQTTGVVGDTGESRQPLLIAAGDSGLGGSTINGNSSLNSIDKKSSHSNDGVSHSQLNGHVPKHSPVKEYPETSNFKETSFIQPNYSGSNDTDSDGYSDVDQKSTDSESDEENTDINSDGIDKLHNYTNRKKLEEISLPKKHCDAENQAFQCENSGGTENSNPIDSYCAQGESSGCSVIDSYSKQGELSSVA